LGLDASLAGEPLSMTKVTETLRNRAESRLL